MGIGFDFQRTAMIAHEFVDHGVRDADAIAEGREVADAVNTEVFKAGYF